MSVTSVSSRDAAGLREALGDAKSILVLSDGHYTDTDACTALLSVAPPDESQYLSVTLDRTPDDVLDTWRSTFGTLPAETGVISVGESTRSVAATQSPSGPGMQPVSIDTVGDPSDLTGIAMAIGAYLDAWSESELSPVMCFDSITSLLFHADENRVFRFLHSTTGRLRELGATAHYHLDPVAYDQSTINVFSALFDAIVDIRDDGEIEVRKRR